MKTERQMRRDWTKMDKEPGVCMHCGATKGTHGSYVCDDCYSRYTPGMLGDLEG